MTRVKLAAGETFASLKVRNFRLFFIGQTISQVGNWLTLIAQTLLVLKLTHSGTALGILTAAQFGPVLILGAFAGFGLSMTRQASIWGSNPIPTETEMPHGRRNAHPHPR